MAKYLSIIDSAGRATIEEQDSSSKATTAS
jgi:hypothetical protein